MSSHKSTFDPLSSNDPKTKEFLNKLKIHQRTLVQHKSTLYNFDFVDGHPFKESVTNEHRFHWEPITILMLQRVRRISLSNKGLHSLQYSISAFTYPTSGLSPYNHTTTNLSQIQQMNYLPSQSINFYISHLKTLHQLIHSSTFLY